ncbi:GATA type transcriptional activator of nitrogen-regulated proteins [Coemansia guatemalensis]|uniref:GATA type transcriptional activator of nitrogen-regulated proteins n=1 Tax=Coemansia guatemalensis TaxID=2761395 RepID=A0A9W8LR74_9FUNG|nr:GATA type transcriptional activator of nitrogen-regulated proteins [Coemansia guatemalensis]
MHHSPYRAVAPGAATTAAAAAPVRNASDTGTVCFNCGVTATPLWRRDPNGNTICNACGLYYKLHNVPRPISMKRTVIKRRRRRTTNSTAAPTTTTMPAMSAKTKREGPLARAVVTVTSAAVPVGRSSSVPVDAAADGSTSLSSSPPPQMRPAAAPSAVNAWMSSKSLPSPRKSYPMMNACPPMYPNGRNAARPQCVGLESLMKAAELSLPMPYTLARPKKRSLSQASQESLLDSLATVATAEISLSKRRALDIYRNGLAPTASRHPAYREELQRECERLHMESVTVNKY